MLTSLISWGLSLIFSGLFVRELAHLVKGMDYRAAGAAAYLGLGAFWAMGPSSSAAMLMATKSAMPPSLFSISGAHLRSTQKQPAKVRRYFHEEHVAYAAA